MMGELLESVVVADDEERILCTAALANLWVVAERCSASLEKFRRKGKIEGKFGDSECVGQSRSWGT